jgi:transposase
MISLFTCTLRFKVRPECYVEQRPAPEESVGIDLGLKDIAVTSDGWWQKEPRDCTF